MGNRNEMSIRFDSYSVNEGFARVAVAASWQTWTRHWMNWRMSRRLCQKL